MKNQNRKKAIIEYLKKENMSEKTAKKTLNHSYKELIELF